MPTHHIYAAINSSSTDELKEEFKKTYIRKNLDVFDLNTDDDNKINAQLKKNVNFSEADSILHPSFHVVVLVKYKKGYTPEAEKEETKLYNDTTVSTSNQNMDVYYVVETKNDSTDNNNILKPKKNDSSAIISLIDDNNRYNQKQKEIIIPFKNIFKIDGESLKKTDLENTNSDIKHYVLYDIVIYAENEIKEITDEQLKKTGKAYFVKNYNVETDQITLTISESKEFDSKNTKNLSFEKVSDSAVVTAGGGKSALQNEKSELAPMKLNKQKAGKNFSLKNHNH